MESHPLLVGPSAVERFVDGLEPWQKLVGFGLCMLVIVAVTYVLGKGILPYGDNRNDRA